MDIEDSLRLALEAERRNHQKNNEYNQGIIEQLKEDLSDMQKWANSTENPLWEEGWNVGHRRGFTEGRNQALGYNRPN